MVDCGRDGDDVIGFGEFCSGMMRYCCYDHLNLSKLAFHILDANRSNRIEKEDMLSYLAILYGRVGQEAATKCLNWVMEQFGKSDKDQLGISMPEWYVLQSYVFLSVEV